MKRPLLSALIIGLIVGAIVMALHVGGWLLRPELLITDLLSHHGMAMKVIGDKFQYVIVFVFAIGVAWMTLATTHRARLSWVVAILLLELAGAAWVCSLYFIFFQPLPAVGGTLLAFGLAAGLCAFEQRQRHRPIPPAVILSERVSEEQLSRIRGSEVARESAPKVYEVTALVCDIANKHDLAEECEPEVFAEITQKFIGHATEALVAAGAYIESAGGEGVVAIFGFPESDKQHAENATRKAMGLAQSFAAANKSSKSEALLKAGVHAGVSSGSMIMAPVKNNGQRSMLVTGEPVELARRFCIANRFYGSGVLLGPRTFELASKILVARPIDFLSGVDVRERHEIYEPVSLALNASRDEITRRDAFWNGVVLYREKRWAEAYAQFQKARDPDGEQDRPLQLYLRRLEPLALQLTNTPLDE
ncbi:MAG TPA: adenylate/guanylate cyclase domain-containing protein [Chthoniobacterales bacterium]|jgi:adenylate cyclase